MTAEVCPYKDTSAAAEEEKKTRRGCGSVRACTREARGRRGSVSEDKLVSTRDAERRKSSGGKLLSQHSLITKLGMGSKAAQRQQIMAI